MMEKAIVKKMYRVFDELHADKALAKQVIRGWEHKEKITEVYAVGYESLVDHLIVPSLNGIYLAKTLDDAIEEMNEMNS